MIKRMLENKMAIGIVCILIAALLSFLVLPGIYKGRDKTVEVWKLQNDIAMGTRVEKSMLKKTEVGLFGLPDGIITDENEIVGKYAKHGITADDLLLASKFSDQAVDERLERLVSEGKMLVSVSVDSTAASVANHLKAGDLVSLVCFIDNTAELFDELKNLEVYSIENEGAVNVEEVQEGDKADTIAATLTLVADENQAKKLVYAEYAGKLHTIFENRGGTIQ